METRYPLHLSNPKREEATERTRNSRSGEEDGDALGLLVALVPKRDVVGYSREQARFCQAKENTGAVNTGGRLGQAKEAIRVTEDARYESFIGFDE